MKSGGKLNQLLKIRSYFLLKKTYLLKKRQFAILILPGSFSVFNMNKSGYNLLVYYKTQILKNFLVQQLLEN